LKEVLASDAGTSLFLLVSRARMALILGTL